MSESLKMSDPNDLGARIAKAKAERDAKAGRADRQRSQSVDNASGMALRYSAELVAAVLVGVGLGLLIDRFAHTAPWGLIVMMVLGMVTGLRNIMRAAQRLTEETMAQAAKPPKSEEKAE